MKKYDEYKDSGVAWIGDVPKHWEVKQLKWLFYNLDNLREPISADKRERTNPQYEYYGASGVIDKIDYYNVDDRVLLIGEDGANLVFRNLPLIYKAEGKFWVNNHAHILKPMKNVDYGYMYYTLEAADYSTFITGSAQPKLSQSNLELQTLPVPPYYEQVFIATYLDTHCAKIDNLISIQQKRIALLQELKQSVITHAVTKGLNPNVEMKQSGVEWIGDVPKHWEVIKLKYKYHFQTGATPNTGKKENFEGDLRWANISDLNGSVVYDTTKHINKEAASECSMNISPKGSLMYSFKLSVGTVAFCGEDMYTNEAIASFIPQKNDLKYLFYCAPIFIIHNANRNIYNAPLLNQELIKNALICLPSLNEQTAIATYLDHKCATIDASISNAQHQIELLQEYKQSLITEVVTGKRKVTDN
jgi:type I restriction-modification system specificity determinant